jgi:FtsP/CotA-like multicopper oxidase with cupredoxin domain
MLVGKALGAPLKGSLLLLALSFGATNAVLDVNGDPIPIPGTCDNTDFGLIEDDVDGYPCSPFGLKPWGQTYKTTEDFNPPRKEKVDTVYRSDGHSAEVYEYDVKGVQANLFTSILPDGDCDGDDKKTRLISYGGHVPAATMYVRDGKETYVQFNNLITEEDAPRPEMFNFEGCNHDDKTGLPITTHNHGQAALAPFDGYAEDRTCYGESKAYMYPNNRPTTGWFHDHALHQTGANVLFGLYGFYIISEKTEVGGCGEPYNLDLMEEVLLFINDVVIDAGCQIRWDVDDGHENNYYGDINLVNGHPFPVLELTRKWYRFRVLNGSVTRPYLLRLVTPDGDDVSSELCTIIGTDGGYFEKGPTPFPATGLMAGVAERWDMVCDFSGLGVSELVLYNDVDERRMKDVPYFTYSHFVAKFTFTGEEDTTAPVFDPENRGHIGTFVPETVLSGAIEDAEGMIENGEAHRTFKFGRGNGHWVINGETWETDRVAADDVGQNTWELWEIDSGGGWVRVYSMIVYWRSRHCE